MRYDKSLVYDIGFNNGDDTAHYLKKGFNVIAVEANPILTAEGNKKFAKAIADGKLTLLNVGIADKEGVLPFYRNHRLSVWSSFNKEQGTRNGTGYDVIDVRCITTKTLFGQYGIPYYLKVDIEGYDYYCINDLPNDMPQPAYVSCEAAQLALLTALKTKGYNKFKIINQANRFKPMSLQQERNPFFGKYLFISTGIRMRVEKFFRLFICMDHRVPLQKIRLETGKRMKKLSTIFQLYKMIKNTARIIMFPGSIFMLSDNTAAYIYLIEFRHFYCFRLCGIFVNTSDKEY